VDAGALSAEGVEGGGGLAGPLASSCAAEGVLAVGRGWLPSSSSEAAQGRGQHEEKEHYDDGI
jgi:hypothetical protein